MESTDFIDVAIVGGGPAGLTAANTLARQLHTAVVFDTQTYRNASSDYMHMLPTWDHKNPAEYRKASRENILANYKTVRFEDVGVTRIEKVSGSHFKVEDAAGKSWNFCKVILAVGVDDIFPEIEGYDKLWGKRIFHCLFCKGYEDKGSSSSGILAVAPIRVPQAVSMARNAAQLTGTVTIYTNGNDALATELGASFDKMTASKFSIETRKIKRILPKPDADRGVVVEFEDGSEAKEETFLVHHPQTRAQGPFAEQLGLAVTPNGEIQAEYPFWGTSVPGVWAVGDCSTPYKVVASAITAGCNASVAASMELQAAKYTK
jgi:thioredoxin reductase